MVIEKKQIITPAQRNRDRLSKGLSQFEYITQRQVLEKKSKEAAKQLDQQIKGFNFTNVNQVIELFNKIPSNIKKYMTIDKDKLMASVADKQAKTFNSISQFKSFYSSLPESVKKNMSVNENYLVQKREQTISKLREKIEDWKKDRKRYDKDDRPDREAEADVMVTELERLLSAQSKNKDQIIDYDTVYKQIREKARNVRRSKEANLRYKQKVKEYNDKLKEIENLMSKKAIKRIEYKDNVPTKFYTKEGKEIDLKSFSKDTRKNIDKAYTSYITETAKAKKDLLKKQEEKYKKLEKDFQVALAGAKLGFNTLNKYQTSKFTPEQQAKIYEAYKETVKPKFEKFKDMFAPNKKFYTDATNEILYRQAINSNAKILNKVNPSIKPIPFWSDIKKFNELNNKINDYIQKLEDINKKVQKSVSLDLKKKAENITNKVLTGQSITPNQYKEYEKEILKRMKDRSIKQQELIASFVLAPDKYSMALKKRKELGEKHPLLNDIKKVGKFTADVLGRSVVIATNDVINFLYLLYGVKGIPKNLKGESYDGLVAKATRNLLEYEQDVIRSEKPFEKVKNDAKKLAKAIGKTTDKVIDVAKFAKEHPVEAAGLTVVGGMIVLGKGVAKGSDKTVNLIRRNPKEALAQSLSFFVPEAIIKTGNKLYKGGKLIATSERAKKLVTEVKLVSNLLKDKTIKTITKNLEGLKNIVKDVKLTKQTKVAKTTKPIIKDITLESNVKKILDDIDKYLYDKNKLKVKLKKYSKQLSDEEIGKLFKFLESGNEKKTIELITDFTKRKVLDTLNKEELLRVLQKHVRKPEEFSRLKKYYLKRFPNEKIRVKDEVVRALTRKNPKTKSYTKYIVNKDGSISKKVIKEVKKKAKEYTVTKEGKIVRTKKLKSKLKKSLLEEAIKNGDFNIITKDMILDKKKFEKLINSLNLDKNIVKKLKSYVSSINEYYDLEKINKKLTLVPKQNIYKDVLTKTDDFIKTINEILSKKSKKKLSKIKKEIKSTKEVTSKVNEITKTEAETIKKSTIKVIDDLLRKQKERQKIKQILKKYTKQLTDKEIGKLFKFLDEANKEKTLEIIEDFARRKVLDTLNKEELLEVLQKYVKKPEEFSKIKKYYLKRFPDEKIRVKDGVVKVLTRKVRKELKTKVKKKPLIITTEGTKIKSAVRQDKLSKIKKEIILEEEINSGNFKVITKAMIHDKKKFEKLINSLNLDKNIVKKLKNYVNSANEFYDLEKINKKLKLVPKTQKLESETMKKAINDLIKSKKAQTRLLSMPAKKYYNKAKQYLKKVRTFEQKAEKYINNPRFNKKIKELKEINNKISKDMYNYYAKQQEFKRLEKRIRKLKDKTGLKKLNEISKENKELEKIIKKQKLSLKQSIDYLNKYKQKLNDLIKNLSDIIKDTKIRYNELTDISKDLKFLQDMKLITKTSRIIGMINTLKKEFKNVQKKLYMQSKKLQNIKENINQLQQKFKQPVKPKIPKRPKKPKKTKIKKPNMKKPRIPKKIKKTKLIKPVQPIPIKPPKIPKIKEQEKIHKFKIPKLPKPSPSSPKRKSYQVRFYDGNKLKVVTPNTAPLKRAANFARKFIKKNKSKINRYLLVEVGTTRIPDVTKTIYDNDFAGTIKNARLIKR